VCSSIGVRVAFLVLSLFTTVPNASITVAEALAVLQAAALRADQSRTIRRALLGLLSALETEE
jgi:hypothetical protein